MTAGRSHDSLYRRKKIIFVFLHFWQLSEVFGSTRLRFVPTPKISSSRGVTDDDSDDGDVGDDDDDDNDHDSWTNVSPPQKSPLQGEWLAHTLCEGRFGCWTPAAANSWNPATQCFWLNFVHLKVRWCFAFKPCYVYCVLCSHPWFRSKAAYGRAWCFI